MQRSLSSLGYKYDDGLAVRLRLCVYYIVHIYQVGYREDRRWQRNDDDDDDDGDDDINNNNIIIIIDVVVVGYYDNFSRTTVLFFQATLYYTKWTGMQPFARARSR